MENHLILLSKVTIKNSLDLTLFNLLSANELFNIFQQMIINEQLLVESK